LSQSAQCELFEKVRKLMMRIAEEYRRPFIARISNTGSIRVQGRKNRKYEEKHEKEMS
jgi:hypothetical protein